MHTGGMRRCTQAGHMLGAAGAKSGGGAEGAAPNTGEPWTGATACWLGYHMRVVLLLLHRRRSVWRGRMYVLLSSQLPRSKLYALFLSLQDEEAEARAGGGASTSGHTHKQEPPGFHNTWAPKHHRGSSSGRRRDGSSRGSEAGGREESGDDKLYCLCLMPHDADTYISCDACGDW